MQPPATKRWKVAEKLTPEADQALAAYPPLMRQILFNRGVTEGMQAIRYLEGRFESFDPFLLTDMREAVDRLVFALENREKIAVYGDFDVDGVTATVLMVEVLQRLGGMVEAYIPNRFDEGYGLNVEALESLAARDVRVVLTVDCGIRSLDEAKRAAELNLDLIISDHHHPSAELPEAYAVICPKRDDDEYPEKNLAGVGLAYKIAQALISRRKKNEPAAEYWLDLVALGTIADMVPLTGENRLLVRKGLHMLRLGQRQGVVSLANAAGLKLQNLNATDVGFGLAPRLNAAGRLESALAAFNLLTTNDLLQAALLAQKLDDQNRQRQLRTREMQQMAEQQLLESAEEYLLFSLDKSFNSGVVGLVAARLTERYYRPAVVGTIMEEGVIRASCRSINEFHITQALDECRDLLVRHGGHALAAGFTVREEHLEQLRERLSKIAWDQLSKFDLRPVINIDKELTLKELQSELLDYLEMLQPTGQGNPDPIFCTRNLEIRSPKVIGADRTHLKMTVTDGRLFLDCIAFRMGYLFNSLPKKVDVAYYFEKNVFNGRESLQLRVVDLKPTGTPD